MGENDWEMIKPSVGCFGVLKGFKLNYCGPLVTTIGKSGNLFFTR